MKTILLAVDGMTPDKKALDYALAICKPVRAGLDVLQIIRPKGLSAGLGRFEKQVHRARHAFENAMVTATYAEAGTPELAGILERKAARTFKRLLPPHPNTAVDYHCMVSGEDPDRLLMQYVDEHRSIIMAIYDTLRIKQKAVAGSAGRKRVVGSLLNGLSVPFVFVREL